MHDHIPRTFTYEEAPYYTLSANIHTQQNSLQISLEVQTSCFPKFYFKQITQLSQEQNFLFDSIDCLFSTLQEMENVEVKAEQGILRINFKVMINKKEQKKFIIIKLQRCLKKEVDEMRKNLERSLKNEGFDVVCQRVENLWKREEENQKIFMKFKEDIEFKVDEMAERMVIQNTKMNIIRQDLNQSTQNISKLTCILCPMLLRLSISEPNLSNFILQDKKIMYVGETSIWTQIIFRDIIRQKPKFSCKIVISKKNNILLGLTLTKNCKQRSSFKKDQKFIAFSANGVLHDGYGKCEVKSSEPIKPIQVITMSIDFDKDQIVWKASGKTLIEYKLGSFGKQDLSYFIQMYDTGDAIEICQ